MSNVCCNMWYGGVLYVSVVYCVIGRCTVLSGRAGYCMVGWCTVW